MLRSRRNLLIVFAAVAAVGGMEIKSDSYAEDFKTKTLTASQTTVKEYGHPVLTFFHGKITQPSERHQSYTECSIIIDVRKTVARDRAVIANFKRTGTFGPSDR